MVQSLADGLKSAFLTRQALGGKRVCPSCGEPEHRILTGRDNTPASFLERLAMAIAPGRYSFMGGAVLGKGNGAQLVLERSSSILTVFSNNEYDLCKAAVAEGKAVCVQWKNGGATQQAQLTAISNTGEMVFVLNELHRNLYFTVSGSEPHTVGVRTSDYDCDQLVIVHTDMTTPFTNGEYQDCVDAVDNGKAVCVEFTTGGTSVQAQLTQKTHLGELIFEFTTGPYHYTYSVDPTTSAHSITETVIDLASGFIPKGEASVATLNALSSQENGWVYTLTDAGTLTDGSLAVVAGDTVAWDDGNSVWYKALNYAPMQYGTNEVHNLATTITAFRTGDVIPVDGPIGTAKISKDDLLRETAENALGSIHSLSDTATEADLVAGNFLAIDGSAGTKKLPLENISSKSSLINPIFSLEEEGKYLNYSGSPTTGTGYNIASFNISGFSKIRISLRLGNNAFGIFYDANDNILDRYNGNSNPGVNYNVLWNVPSGAVTLKTSYSVDLPCSVVSEGSLESRINEELKEDTEEINKRASKDEVLDPSGTIIANDKYLDYRGTEQSGTGYNIASYDIGGFSQLQISLRLGNNAFGIFYDAKGNILDMYNGNSNPGINYNVLWSVPARAVTLKTSYSAATPIKVYPPASLEHRFFGELDDVKNELGPNYTKQSSTTKAGIYPNSVSGTFQSSGTYDSFVFELAEGVAVDIVVEGGNFVLTAETDTAPELGDYYSDLGRSTHIDRLCHKYLAVCTQASAISCTVCTSDGKSVKKVRALFIGNSMTQDNIMYVPWVLKSAYGNNIDFEIADFYIGSYTIAKFVDDCVNGTQKAEQYSVAKNNKRWTHSGSNVVALDEAISSNDWDLICVQGYFNNTLYTEDMTQLESLVRYISDNANGPFKLCFLMHQTYRDGVLPNIIAGTKYSVSNSEVRLVFPCGLASEFAKSDWAESFLTADGTHNQEGLPCIIGAYVIGDLLGKEAGLSSRIMGNKSRLTSSQMSQLNIAGQHGTYQDGDETAWYQAQCFATKALSAGKSVFNSGCDDSLSLITE